MLLAASQKTLFFASLIPVKGCAGIFDNSKSLKMKQAKKGRMERDCRALARPKGEILGCISKNDILGAA